MTDAGERLVRSLAALREAGIAALARSRGIPASGPELAVAAMRKAPTPEVIADLEAAHSGFLRHAAYRLRKRRRRIAAALRGSALARLLGGVGRIFGIALLMLPLCAHPSAGQRAGGAAADRLLKEAQEAWDATARDADDVAGLRGQERKIVDAIAKLARIRCDHPDAPLAREVAAGRGLRGVARDEIAFRLEQIRLALRSRMPLEDLERAQDRWLCDNFGKCPSGANRPEPVLRDCADCPQMVALPSGSYLMGAAPEEEELENLPCDMRGLSSPQVSVRLPRGILIGRHEVTRGEYAIFARETGEALQRSCLFIGNGPTLRDRAWHDPGFLQDDRHPVVCVSWEDARKYADWLARRTGKPYRLPTEAEWEYAARGGLDWPRPWAGGQTKTCEYANVLDRSAQRALPDRDIPMACDDQHGFTAPVGSFRPNSFGLHDMLGNAWEWVADCWTIGHGTQPVMDSTGCVRRVLRGGSYLTPPGEARPALRSRAPADSRAAFIGFRVARDM